MVPRGFGYRSSSLPLLGLEALPSFKSNPLPLLKIRTVILGVLSILSATIAASGQSASEPGRTLTIRKASGEIRIDGERSEAAWREVEVATDFAMVLPMDTSSAELRTEVRMTFDDKNLYIFADCHHGGWRYMVESLRRDWNFLRNDNFIFFLDTFMDKTNGFTFGANAAGAQWDGILSDGGRADLSWDNKWISVNRQYADRWTFEAAIPFTSIRFKSGVQLWGVNFSRNDLTTTEKSAWSPVPRQFPTSSLAFTGKLVWETPPPAPGLNVSLIPYGLGARSKDFTNGEEGSWRSDFGGDAKVALTSSVNLDLTVNPDFSQVDVDRQVTNLDRFELFFPERRQFFLENGDLFANMGYSTLRPFFSRRIGLGAPIRYGARISGKLNRDWRIGALNMATGAVPEQGAPGYDFSTIAVQRRVFARSFISGMVINKERLGGPSSDPDYKAYNRHVGLEYNLQSANNKWTGKALYYRSITPGISSKNEAIAGNLQYSSKTWFAGGQLEYVGEQYNPEVGYVPRRGYLKVNASTSRLFFPSGGSLLTHGPSFGTTRFYDPRAWSGDVATGKQMDQETYMAYNLTFRSRAVLTGWIAQNFVRLYALFDPTNSGLVPLEVGSEHRWRAFGLEYASKPQQLLTWSGSMRYGGYYADGTRFNLSGELAYRVQPYGALSISASYNRIALPAPWNKVDFLLLSPRLDLTLTNRFFITGFAQYNEQSKNINLNARLQWRYKPASDFFLVFTDNYLQETFAVRNRAIVAKWTYWWNR